MTNLTSRETFLVALTFVVIAATIILSLSISLILPNHITSRPRKYVSNMENKSEEELKELCGCSDMRSNKDDIDCVPLKIPKRSFKSNLECTPEEWNLQKSFSYLASLTDPAYVDDENVRIFVCACVIISKLYILGGWTCVAHKSEDEIKEMRVRVGSIYWSKGGKEIRGVSIEQDYRGLQVFKIKPEFNFNDQIQALQLPVPGKAFPVSSAVTLDWETNKLHNRFFLKNWTSYPCPGYDIVGEIRNGIYFEEGAKSLVLVTEKKMLVGFLGNITFDDGDPTYLFADLQCDTYPSWLYYAIDIYGDGSFRPISTVCDENEPILIYQGENCNVPELIDDTSTELNDDTSTELNDDTSTTSIDDTSITSIDDTSIDSSQGSSTTSTQSSSTTSTQSSSTTSKQSSSTTSKQSSSTTSIGDITTERDIFDPIIFNTDPIYIP